MSDEKKPLLAFPCDFVVKVFGVASDTLEKQVMDVIDKHQKDLHPKVQIRPSKDGKYLALSITVHVNSQNALDDIYRDLTNSSFVLMAL